MLRALLLILLTLTCAHAQDVRITEFLPVNTGEEVDEEGIAAPWIEIWNPSPTSSVTMTNWRLVHGGNQWFFPTGFQIPPDEYVIIFADGKNRTTVTAPLHTNFTLSNSGGGPLQLVRADSMVASAFATYPALPANVSYGRDIADPNQVGIYAIPTPGDPNNYAGGGVSGKVAMSVSSCAFQGSLSVSLAELAPVAGAVIRYTTNGTIPNSVSAVYNGTPINVASTMQLRARVFEPGKLPGETESCGYLLVDAGTWTFSSPIPVAVVSNFGLGTFPDSGDQSAFMWVWQPGADGRARLSNPPTIATRCAVDRRGSSTLGNPKTNFNLESRNMWDDDDRDIGLMGMPSGSDWVFHAPYDFDRSLLHNPFAYALSNSIGRYAPRNRMAEVFVEVNGGSLSTTSGDYYGVYNVLEKIRRDNDRVDLENLGTYDNDAVGKTGGYIFKVDRRDPGDSGFSAGGQTLAYYDPKEIEIKTPQRDPQEQYLTQYINSYISALNSANYRDPNMGYAAWLDVPAAIDHHLLNVWMFNVDALRLSGYIHKERGGKLVYGPIWDFDRALSSTDGRDANPSVWRAQTGDLGTDFFNWPNPGQWWGRLFTDPDFYQKYIDRWVELRRGPFSPAAVNALLDQLNGEITDEAVGRDLARWSRGKRTWTSPFNGTFYPANQTAEVQRIKDWLEQRAIFFNSQWVAPVTLSHNGGSITPGLSLTMTAAAGSTIYYTLDGSDPRPSGGAAPTASNVFTYTGPITINATTRVKARAYNPSWTALTGANNPPLVSRWSGLTNVRFSTDAPAGAGNLAITEINYHPVDPTPAELAINPVLDAADFEFIELKNFGDAALDVDGVQMSVGARFTFTSDVAITLGPGEFLIIAANPAAFAVRYGNVPNVIGPFAGDLSNAGEQILVKASDGSVIADFTYDDVWYPLSDGVGRTLEARTPLPPGYDAASFRASFRDGGTPGFEDVPVVIDDHPESKTVNPGQPITLSVTATGKPAPTYQWRKNGSAIEGATGATFQIGNAVEDDEGNYDVLVENIGGMVPSNVAVVKVNDPVQITQHPVGDTVSPGTEITLSVVADGTGPFSYQWRKNGSPIGGAVNAQLVILATEDDEGSYDVVVSNMVNEETSNGAVLSVNDPVLITAQPVGGLVNPGTPITLSVTATGTGPLSYQWRKDGADLDGATAAELQLAGNASDEGDYDVVVSNIVGSVTSDATRVEVKDPVTITLQPASRMVKVGGSVTFTVAAAGTGPFGYQWRKNGSPIAGANGASHTIAVVSASDAGEYDVIVSNDVAPDTSGVAQLKIVDFTALAGTYQGLLQQEDLSDPATNPRAGRFTATVTKAGRLTGKLDFFGLTRPFNIKLDANLTGSQLISRPNGTSVAFQIFLNGIDSTIEAKAIDGTYEALGTAPLIPKRTKTTPPALMGRYTLLLEAGAGAPNDLVAPGTLTVNIAKTGSIAWIGKLADNAALRGSGWLNEDDEVAFYAAPYGARLPYAGHVSGPLAFLAETASGELGWNKPPQIRGDHWKGGLNVFLLANGFRYNAPARGVPAIIPSSLNLKLEGPVSGGVMERSVQITSKNTFTFAPNGEKLKLRLHTTTGAVTGSYFDSLFQKNRKLEGVLLQQPQEIHGFFPGLISVGSWSVTAAPQ